MIEPVLYSMLEVKSQNHFLINTLFLGNGFTPTLQGAQRLQQLFKNWTLMTCLSNEIHYKEQSNFKCTAKVNDNLNKQTNKQTTKDDKRITNVDLWRTVELFSYSK